MIKRTSSIVMVVAIIISMFSTSLQVAAAETTDVTTVTFTENTNYIVNPYMGAMTKASSTNKIIDGSLVYSETQWDDFEPNKGDYRFTDLENKNNFSMWLSKNQKFVLRFNMDYPDGSINKDIPEWLYQEIKQEALNKYTALLNAAKSSNNTNDISKYTTAVNSIKNDVTLYNDFIKNHTPILNLPGIGTYYQYTFGSGTYYGGFSPNYASEVLIQAHSRLMKQLGFRYDDPEKVFMVLAGSLGHWGEMHTTYIRGAEDVGRYPAVAVESRYLNEYANNFNNTFVTVRYPREVAKNNNFGLYNHGIGNVRQVYDWYLDYAKNGYKDYSTGDFHPAMPDFYKVAPSVGELFYTGNDDYFSNANIGNLITQIQDLHLTYFDTEATLSSAEYTNNRMKLLSKIGYRFVLNNASFKNSVAAGGEVALNTNWSNHGVAPFYFDWDIVVELRDSNSKTVVSQVIENDIRNIQSGVNKNYLSSIAIPSTLVEGSYSVHIGMVNPTTKKAEIKLAITATATDNMYKLGTIVVKPVEAPVVEVPVVEVPVVEVPVVETTPIVTVPTEPTTQVNNSLAKTVAIYGGNSLNTYALGSEYKFTGVVRSASGEMPNEPIIWTVLGNDKVTVNSTGLVTILPGVSVPSFTLVAKVKANTNISTTKVVTLNNIPVTTTPIVVVPIVVAPVIVEPVVVAPVVVAPVVTASDMSVTVYGSTSMKIYGQASTSLFSVVVRNKGLEVRTEQVTWSISGNDKVTVDQNGLVTLNKGVLIKSFTLIATLKSNPSVKYEKTVTLY